MTAQLSPTPVFKGWDNNGLPLVGGKLFTYIAGTTTKQATYTDYTQATPNTNPIILNARGECALWLDPTKSYKLVLSPSTDTDPPTNPLPGWTVDQVNGSLSPSASIIPSVDNVYNLGSSTNRWANAYIYQQLYIGANNYPVYDSVNKIFGYIGQTGAELAASVTPTNYAYAPGDVRRYGAVLDGVTNDATALNNAILSWNGRGVVNLAKGTLLVASQIVLPAGIRLVGAGFSETNGTGSGNRGGSCILRGFAGTSCTVLASGNDCGIDQVDIDNNLQGTGECLQVTGSRMRIGQLSCRNSGGDGLRIGKTDAGASTVNANAWKADQVVVCGNAGAGMRIDDTNTTTSLSYPLGASNANAGFCAHIDARNNGTDGLQLGNCNDNVFTMVVSQSNTGCGIRFKTDGTNAGPRCNKIIGNDCESNTGNDIQIDAATLPASGPGLYNVVFGNRSVAVTSRIVDNSTGSLVLQWNTNFTSRAYHWGTDINVLNAGGVAAMNMAVGANLSPARLYAVASGAADSIMRGQIHKNGGALVDGWELNQYGVFRPLLNYLIFAYTTGVAMTLDAAQGCDIDLTINDGAAWTINAPINPILGQNLTLTVRNTSGGALGAATFNAVFKQSAWVSPATTNSRSISWKYNGANWVEKSRTPADVPN